MTDRQRHEGTRSHPVATKGPRPKQSPGTQTSGHWSSPRLVWPLPWPPQTTGFPFPSCLLAIPVPRCYSHPRTRASALPRLQTLTEANYKLLQTGLLLLPDLGPTGEHVLDRQGSEGVKLSERDRRVRMASTSDPAVLSSPTPVCVQCRQRAAIRHSSPEPTSQRPEWPAGVQDKELPLAR